MGCPLGPMRRAITDKDERIAAKYSPEQGSANGPAPVWVGEQRKLRLVQTAPRHRDQAPRIGSHFRLLHGKRECRNIRYGIRRTEPQARASQSPPKSTGPAVIRNCDSTIATLRRRCRSQAQLARRYLRHV